MERALLRVERWRPQQRGRCQLQDSVYAAKPAKRAERGKREARYRAFSERPHASCGSGSFSETRGKTVRDIFLRAKKKRQAAGGIGEKVSYPQNRLEVLSGAGALVSKNLQFLDHQCEKRGN
jgi:hypothetical protein